jgi:probable rRNA maturation factor
MTRRSALIDRRSGRPELRRPARRGRRAPRLRVTVTDAAGRPAPSSGLARWLERIAPAAARGTLAVALVSDRQIRRLNRDFRDVDKATDVLSFPSGESHRSQLRAGPGLRRRLRPGSPKRGSAKAARPRPPLSAAPGRRRLRGAPGPKPHAPSPTPHLGDLAIALGVARRQARDEGHSLGAELKVLALHGLLHLLGYDHERDRGAMDKLEDRLRRRAGLPTGLIARTASGRPARR